MNCVSSDCAEEARWLVPWPGQRSVMCDRCLARAQRYAQMFGFELPLLPVESSAEYSQTVLEAARRLGGKIG